MKSRGLMRSSWPRRIPIAALPIPPLLYPLRLNATAALERSRSLARYGIIHQTCFFRVLGFRGDGYHHDLHPCRMLLAQINSNSGRTSPCNDSIDAPCAQRAIHHPETQALPSTLSGLAVGKLWPVQVSSPIEQRRAAQPRFPHVRLARFRLTAMFRANLSTSMYCNCMCTRHLWVSCAVRPACSLSRSALREPIRPSFAVQ
ncbi:hypothetical protein J3E68DRAFT_231559 [Trichoderma sp. SZMC 28012]